MSKKLAIVVTLTVLLSFPVTSFAQPGSLNIPLTVVASNIAGIILEILWSVAVAFIIVMFILAGFKFLTAQGDLSKVAEARQAVIWGLVGVAVVILAWSVILVIRNQIGV